jgi:hypothetical protein
LVLLNCLSRNVETREAKDGEPSTSSAEKESEKISVGDTAQYVLLLNCISCPQNNGNRSLVKITGQLDFTLVKICF